MRKLVIILIFILLAGIYHKFFYSVELQKNWKEASYHKTKISPTPQPTVIYYGKIKRVMIRNPLKELQAKTAITKTKNNHLIFKPQLIDNKIIVMGDVFVEDGKKFDPANPVKIAKPKKWKQGRIPIKFEVNDEITQRVKIVLKDLEQKTSLKFLKYSGQRDYIKIIRSKKICYSHLGRINGGNIIGLNENCHRPQILHEIMHALGFFHEHSRADRDEFLAIHWYNIEEKFHAQFEIIPKEFLPIDEFPFDFKSLMLYAPGDFAKDKRYATISTVAGEIYEPNRDDLSTWDLEKINAAYP